MLSAASDLVGLKLEATDGGIGAVEDLLFDDRHWTVRWLVVDTGDWLPGRSVLLPPDKLLRPARDGRAIRADLARAQVENSPALATDPPVSRQYEMQLYDYYGWAPYWAAGMTGPGLAAPLVPPLYAAGAKPAPSSTAPPEPQGDPVLMSADEVTGYNVHARDGEIGHVEDFLVDDEAWAIRYLVVATRNWWPGKKVLVSPHWVSDIAWSEHTVRFDTTRDRIKSSPEYDPETFDRVYEGRLHAHYDMPTYWL
jgi:hypothetical protein